VKAQMGSLQQQSYAVTPDSAEGETFKKGGLIPIVTDGSYFLTQIKKHAVVSGLMLNDEIYDAASALLERVRDEHRALHRAIGLSAHPELIYAASYQDGMIHALERAVEMRGSGRYSQRGRNLAAIRGYLDWRKEKLKKGVYEDVAYIDGYVNALTYLLTDLKERRKIPIPLYYAFGVNADLVTLDDFRTALKHRPAAHKASLARARRWSRKLSPGSAVEFHHPPWL